MDAAESPLFHPQPYLHSLQSGQLWVQDHAFPSQAHKCEETYHAKEDTSWQLNDTKTHAAYGHFLAKTKLNEES